MLSIIINSIISGSKPGAKQWRKLNMKHYQWQTRALKTLKKQSKFKKCWKNVLCFNSHLLFIFGRPIPISDHIPNKILKIVDSLGQNSWQLSHIKTILFVIYMKKNLKKTPLFEILNFFNFLKYFQQSKQNRWHRH